MPSEVWVERVRKTLEAQKFGLKMTLVELESARTWLNGALDKNQAAINRANSLIDRLEKDLSKLDLRREDPVVWRRTTPGPRPAAFHSTLDCGWVRDHSHYEPLLWSEAKDAGMGPCVSCGWGVENEARKLHERDEPDTGPSVA
jgi:hypothetical protein